MKQLIVAFAALGCLSLGLVGSAHAKEVGSGDCAIAKKRGKACVIDFGKGDDISATHRRPDGDNLRGRSQTRFSNLIKPRVSFRAEIIKAAENL